MGTGDMRAAETKARHDWPKAQMGGLGLLIFVYDSRLEGQPYSFFRDPSAPEGPTPGWLESRSLYDACFQSNSNPLLRQLLGV